MEEGIKNLSEQIKLIIDTTNKRLSKVILHGFGFFNAVNNYVGIN